MQFLIKSIGIRGRNFKLSAIKIDIFNVGLSLLADS